MAVHRNCLDLFHYDGGAADRLSNSWSLRGPHWQTLLLVMTIAGVGVMSLLGGFLPTYPQVGVWAYVIICALRLCMGIFFGDEYAVGHTFSIEYAPKKKRGAIGGFFQSGFPLGYVSASLVFAGFVVNQQGSHVGLRLAHCVQTGVVPFFLALYIRKNLDESPEFEKTKAHGQNREIAISLISSSLRNCATFSRCSSS